MKRVGSVRYPRRPSWRFSEWTGYDLGPASNPHRRRPVAGAPAAPAPGRIVRCGRVRRAGRSLSPRVLDAPFLVCVGPGPSGGHLRRPPQPHDVLYLVVGTRSMSSPSGCSLAAIGAAQAVAFAWFRYGGLRLPAPSAYRGPRSTRSSPRVIDEAAFRGALQGILLAAVCPMAVPSSSSDRLHPGTPHGRAGPASLHARAPRSGSGGLRLGHGAHGRHWGGLLAHTLTSFALFVCTGHAGQVRRGAEPDEVEALHVPRAGARRDARTRRRAQQRRLALHRGRLGRATLCG